MQAYGQESRKRWLDQKISLERVLEAKQKRIPVDQKIIKLLMKDAQMPFSKIAEQLGVGTDTVIRKYHRLKKEGVIHNASVIVDLEKCGHKGNVFFLASVLAGLDLHACLRRLLRSLMSLPWFIQ